MGRFVVIGLGSFGEYVAKSLMEQGNEVLAIDKNPAKVQRIKDVVSSAMTADASQNAFLQEIDFGDVDAVVVGLSEREMAAGILITMHLRESSVKKIVVKVTSDDHKAIIDKIGATETIFPERDVAERLSSRLSSANVYDQISLSDDYGILEIVAPAKFVVDRLEQLDMRSTHGVQVLFLRRSREGEALSDFAKRNEWEVVFPRRDTAVKTGDILILAGAADALEKIKNMKPSVA